MLIPESLSAQEIEARCGRVVRAQYLEHEYFDSNSNLCQTLHYVFLRYTPGVVFANGWMLSKGIKHFFDYLVEHASINPEELRPSTFGDITIEIFLGFQDFLLRKKKRIVYAEKLKSAFGVVAKQHGTIPLLLFPIVARPQFNKTEPLGDDAFNDLERGLRAHIDLIYKKIAYREVVAEAEPYHFDSIPPNDPINRVTVGKWQIDHARSLRTLLDHGFPMSQSLEELAAMMRSTNIMDFKRDCDTILKALFSKYTLRNKQFRLDNLLEMYFPTTTDQAAIILFLLLQSGWNKESVIDIDGDDFEQILSGSVDESLSVIFSEKNRSQGLELPYDAPKQITAFSDREDPYSIHNLILLAGRLSAPLKGYEFDTGPGVSTPGERNELYLCLRAWGDWFRVESRHTSASVMIAYTNGVEQFLKKYEVVENGKRLTKSKDVTTRLRPTWLLRKKIATALSIISTHFGHADSGTTDIYYDSSGAAMQERRGRLRDELEAITGLLVTRQFKGLLSKQANEQASCEVKIFTLPGKDRPLWGCENQMAPDWPGHESYIRAGQKCFQLEKCLGCSKVRIFEDSLPYLMERMAHVEYELEVESDGPRTAELHWEMNTLDFLINHSHEEEEIKKAARYRRRHAPLLPRDLSSLRIIFEDEALNE